VDTVSDKTLSECGFEDPLMDENWEFSWDRLKEIAQCITRKPEAEVRFRDKDVRSFIEREK